jgi:F-type H+-transporting ATPase subunit delta
MSTLAKTYVKALVRGKDAATVEVYMNQLSTITSAFSVEKFNTILTSGDVSASDKVNLILSFFDGFLDKAVWNLVQLLGKNRRLNIIPEISCSLASYYSDLTKKYTGVVYSNESLSAEYISTLENQFAQKFDVSLTLNNQVGNFDGVKVEIDGLGVEIGLSNERLRSQMIEHILKAV